MEVEVFTLCDYAQDSRGKLNIIGTFDTIGVKKFPSEHPLCSIAGRVRFDNSEAGDHKLTISCLSRSNKALFPTIEGSITLTENPNQPTSALNISFTLGPLKLEKAEIYSLNLLIDKELIKTIPFYITTQKDVS